MSRIAVTTDRVAPPVGPYSAAVHGTASMFLSGQVAQDPATGQLVGADAETQARQVFANMRAVLAAANKTERDVLRVTLYLRDMADFAAVNAVYTEVFTPPYPARTAIAVLGLPLGALVEADVIAG